MLDNKIKSCGDIGFKYREFRETVGWEENSNGVVWSFGEDDRPENMLVDSLSYSA